jgi:ABC-type nitrate/sulfonate/bicarbonate transport system substrate-binding protein
MKRISIFIFCVLCFLFAPIIAGAQRLTAGYVSKDLNYLPFFIGLKKGLYAKE